MQERTKEQRRAELDKRRSGQASVNIPFAPNAPVFVKTCPSCHAPSPWTDRWAFLCRPCRLLFF